MNLLFLLRFFLLWFVPTCNNNANNAFVIASAFRFAFAFPLACTSRTAKPRTQHSELIKRCSTNEESNANSNEKEEENVELDYLDLDLIRFQRRQQALQWQWQGQWQWQWQWQWQQETGILPPQKHASLEPKELVQELLEALRDTPYYDFDPLKPRPHPGVLALWNASTREWQNVMAAAVGVNVTGATNNASRQTQMQMQTQMQIVSALGRFFARPNQQFAILVNQELHEPPPSPNSTTTSFWIDFPTDVVDCWGDDECWVECRLRQQQQEQQEEKEDTNELLVVMGWTLKKQKLYTTCTTNQKQKQNHNHDQQEEAWFVDGIDWQDFRNAYRPGIGREEWERICG